MYTQIMAKNIRIGDIAPTVLFSHNFPDDYGVTLSLFPSLPLRRIYDYELDYILTDGGEMLIDGVKYPMQNGTVFFRKPGVQAQALNPFRCITVIVDITGKSDKTRENYLHKAPQQIQTDYQNPFLAAIKPHTVSEEAEKLFYLFQRINKEYTANWPHTPVILRAYVLEILYILYVEATRQHDPVLLLPKRYHKAVRRATEYVNANFAQKLMLSDIADYVELSPNYFSKLFLECMGINLSAYITNVRLQKAKELLIYTDLPVVEIAELSGFESQAYFISVFRRFFKTTPGKFRSMNT